MTLAANVSNTDNIPTATLKNHRLWVYHHPGFANHGMVILIPTYDIKVKLDRPIHGVVLYRPEGGSHMYQLGKDFVWASQLFHVDTPSGKPALRPYYGSVTLTEDRHE